MDDGADACDVVDLSHVVRLDEVLDEAADEVRNHEKRPRIADENSGTSVSAPMNSETTKVKAMLFPISNKFESTMMPKHAMSSMSPSDDATFSRASAIVNMKAWKEDVQAWRKVKINPQPIHWNGCDVLVDNDPWDHNGEVDVDDMDDKQWFEYVQRAWREVCVEDGSEDEEDFDAWNGLGFLIACVSDEVCAAIVSTCASLCCWLWLKPQCMYHRLCFARQHIRMFFLFL